MKNRRALSIIEYTVLIAVVVAALWAMQAYIKRAFQGRYRQAADTFGGEQYEYGSTVVK